ncbi:hypothetical protein A2U01_0051490, partial [Trifolium medium]|nr:hypothetical protein [Trifolium medium]
KQIESDARLECTPIAQMKNFKKISSGVVLEGENSHAVNANKGGKRVSPQTDEDENAPIKLLRRAVKIEKIA